VASIRLENLTKDFDGLRAVADLNLTIDHGSFVALLGPSGCGKTTTMNMIAGLEQPTTGEIYFGDQPMKHVPPGKRRVGFVFQNYAIFTNMTVYDNLAFGPRARGAHKSDVAREVQRVATFVGIANVLGRPAGQLSVNDMQKVALGRSMIVRPAIFLLDEPFSNLDAAFRAYMRAELKHIQHELGQTMVYVTHDQVEAMSMADRIAVMNLGVLQQFGAPLEIYNHPVNTFVAGFVGSTQINFLPATEVPVDAPPGDRGTMTLAIRPEYLMIVAPGAPEATIGARVSLVEPLGPKDIVHFTWRDRELRALGTPGRRPGIGEHVGLLFDPSRVQFFDTRTGAVIS
jgi:multiple sugar transport system ATP-binding protein